jgi:rhamnulokinase/L-fuculokinase
VNKTIRVLRNVAGLWLEQESKRQWEREGEKITFNGLSEAAQNSVPLKSLINVDSPEFAAPGNMPDRIRGFCKRTNQYIPQTKGEIVRCIFDSLALKYKHTLMQINELQGFDAQHIHIVGGGTKESVLCRYTAEACKIPVYAGPVEATAIGNLSVQMMSRGEISNLKEVREIIADSFDVACYEPKNGAMWDERYEKILG